MHMVWYKQDDLKADCTEHRWTMWLQWKQCWNHQSKLQKAPLLASHSQTHSCFTRWPWFCAKHASGFELVELADAMQGGNIRRQSILNPVLLNGIREMMEVGHVPNNQFHRHCEQEVQGLVLLHPQWFLRNPTHFVSFFKTSKPTWLALQPHSEGEGSSTPHACSHVACKEMFGRFWWTLKSLSPFSTTQPNLLPKTVTKILPTHRKMTLYEPLHTKWG